MSQLLSRHANGEISVGHCCNQNCMIPTLPPNSRLLILPEWFALTHTTVAPRYVVGLGNNVFTVDTERRNIERSR
jgi:hypothetical protein